jgi:hypothetical protein
MPTVHPRRDPGDPGAPPKHSSATTVGSPTNWGRGDPAPTGSAYPEHTAGIVVKTLSACPEHISCCDTIGSTGERDHELVIDIGTWRSSTAVAACTG